MDLGCASNAILGCVCKNATNFEEALLDYTNSQYNSTVYVKVVAFVISSCACIAFYSIRKDMVSRFSLYSGFGIQLYVDSAFPNNFANHFDRNECCYFRISKSLVMASGLPKQVWCMGALAGVVIVCVLFYITMSIQRYHHARVATSIAEWNERSRVPELGSGLMQEMGGASKPTEF